MGLGCLPERPALARPTAYRPAYHRPGPLGTLAILGEVTIRQRRKKLEEMTQGNGLSDAYTGILTRLKAQKGNKSILGLKVLMWVLHSEHPLKLEELCHALGVELGSIDLDHENLPALRTLLASSLGLVTIEASSSTVRLVHFTLQEHLLCDSTLFNSPRSTIAEVCLTYLNFRCVRELSPTLHSAPTALPLLEYASFYWGDHARKEMTENVKILALKLLNKFDGHISAQLILLRYNTTTFFPPYLDSAKGPTGFTGLHGAAFLGIVEILVAVLEMKEWDVNERDIVSYTPVIWAALRGHEGVVKVLLERGDINPDLPDHSLCLTPLSWAILWGHEGIAKLFLKQEGVNPNGVSTQYSYTPLFWAAYSGHAGIIKMLLEREDINPNQASGEYGTTPLLVAAQLGREEIVGVLLEREDIKPNLADTNDDRTPLSHAAVNGYEEVVKMLLERNDIRTDIRDNQNQTPLSLALSQGHHKIARMISERTSPKSNTAGPIIQALPPSAQHGEEPEAEKQLRCDHPNTKPAVPIGPPTSPPADLNTPEGAPDCKDSISNSADSTIPSTEPPSPPRPHPRWRLKFWHSLCKIGTLTRTPRQPTINRHLVIASFVCILAFLLYILPFPLPDMFSFYRLPEVGSVLARLS